MTGQLGLGDDVARRTPTLVEGLPEDCDFTKVRPNSEVYHFTTEWLKRCPTTFSTLQGRKQRAYRKD